jgi:hypothetical protein
VVFEELCFCFQGIRQRFVSLNVLLGSVDYTDKTKLEGVDPARQDFESIGTMVHKVELCEHTNCSLALWINLASQLQSFRVNEVDIGWRYGQDDTVGFGNVFTDQVPGLLFDVRGLVADGDL